MNGPATYSDSKLDTIARAAFYNILRVIRKELSGNQFRIELIESYAFAANAASCGFHPESEGERSTLYAVDDDEPTRPASLNDDMLDQIGREVFMLAAARVNDLVAKEAHQPEMIHALAQIMDAAACGFKDEEEEE